jgi:two-component system LytT family response regulator
MNTKVHLVGRKSVSPDRVILLKAEANYTEVFLIDGESIVLSKTLKELEKRFVNFSFFRTHKSYLINLNYIERFCPNESQEIGLRNNLIVELSRRRRNEFISFYRKNRA